MKTITYIIPALNEEESIGRLISSIKAQRFDVNIRLNEIVLVDNGSIDKTVEIASKMGVRVIVNKEKTIGGLRNLGAYNSKCDILVFLDADNILTENVLTRLVDKLNDEKTGAVSVLTRPEEDSTWVEKTWYYHLNPECVEYRKIQALASGAFAIKREVFDIIEGFNEKLEVGEDTDLSDRIIKSGYDIFLDTATVIYNTGYPDTLMDFIQREIWHGDSWKTLMVHKKFDLFTCYLLSILFLVLVFPFLVMKRSRFIYLLPFQVILPVIFRAFRKRKKLDLMFIRLVVTYLIYIISRIVSLLRL